MIDLNLLGFNLWGSPFAPQPHLRLLYKDKVIWHWWGKFDEEKMDKLYAKDASRAAKLISIQYPHKQTEANHSQPVNVQHHAGQEYKTRGE